MRRAYDADLQQESLDARVARLATSQHGAFSRAQAVALGATRDAIRRRVASGRWEQVAADAFRMAGAARSARQALMIATLAWGEPAVISHRAAAGLRRLAGFTLGEPELTLPRDRRRKAPGIIHRGTLEAVDREVVDAIPVTTVARTLIDIAGVAPRDRVEEAFDDAVRRGLVSTARLRWRVDALATQGRAGISVMRTLLAARTPAETPQSVFETRLVRTLLRAGLPRPVLQHEIHDPSGRLVAIADAAYPEARLAIEADGFTWHAARTRFERDRVRRNALTLLGWRVIHVTWDRLHRHPDEVAEEIRRALADG